ncbi:MAG: inositol monophosphatase [Candidatus Diapherotrites archaeon]|nr:inositol monophosphatase [Candidatus Diapherotrites archaeon]
MLEKEFRAASKASAEAGKIMLKYFRKDFFVKKKGRIDIVTQADLESEKKIHEIISKSFPRDSFLEEESGKSGSGEGRVWVVDPIDGTINFAHGVPWFCSSIALVVEGKPVLGAAFNPVTNDFFHAVKGKGAFWNNEQISVSKNTELIECVLATGFPYERGELARKTIAGISSLIGGTQGIRQCGSAVLDMCLVAAGSFDGYFEHKLFPWDAAAAILIVAEAGGVVTDFSGKKATPFSEAFVASNGLIHGKLLEHLVKP